MVEAGWGGIFACGVPDFLAGDWKFVLGFMGRVHSTILWWGARHFVRESAVTSAGTAVAYDLYGCSVEIFVTNVCDLQLGSRRETSSSRGRTNRTGLSGFPGVGDVKTVPKLFERLEICMAFGTTPPPWPAPRALACSLSPLSPMGRDYSVHRVRILSSVSALWCRNG